MIKTFTDCINEYGSQYRLTKALISKEIFKIEDGIYSDCEIVPEIAVIAKKYPHAIITGEYAFYYYGMTDVIPDRYSLATKANAAKITDSRVFQIYIQDDIFELGVQTIDIEGYEIHIYDKERMLIELLRRKNKIPYDLYKEILNKYRTSVQTLQIWRIQEYADIFPKSRKIKKALDEEVM